MPDGPTLFLSIDATGAQAGAERFARATDDVAMAAAAATRSTESYSRQFQQLLARIDPAARAQQQYTLAQRTLDAELAKGTISLQRHSELVARAGEAAASATRRSTAVTGEYSREFERLAARLNPAMRAELQFAEAQRIINRELAAGTISTRQHAEYIAMAGQSAARAAVGINTLRGAFMSANTVVGGFVAGLAGGAAFAGINLLVNALASIPRQFVAVTDASTSARNALTLVLGSAEQASIQFDRLRDISIETGTDISSLRDIFFRVAAAARDLGLSEEQMNALTASVSRLNVAAAAAGPGAAAAMMQLGQAMASGRVQAEEWNSIAEQLPATAQFLAQHIDGAGGSISRLKDMIKEGEIAGRDFARVFVEFGGEIEAVYADMPRTISSAWSSLGNVMQAYIDDADRAGGTSNSLAESILDLANDLNEMRGGFQDAVGNVNSFFATLENWGNWLDRQNWFGELIGAIDRLIAKTRQLQISQTTEQGWMANEPSWARQLQEGASRQRLSANPAQAVADLGFAESWRMRGLQLPATVETQRQRTITPTGPGRQAAVPRQPRAVGGRSVDTTRVDAARAEAEAKRQLDRALEIEREKAQVARDALEREQRGEEILSRMRIESLEQRGREVEAIEMKRDAAIASIAEQMASEEQFQEARVLINRQADAEIEESRERFAEEQMRILDEIGMAEERSLRARGDTVGALEMENTRERRRITERKDLSPEQQQTLLTLRDEEFAWDRTEAQMTRWDDWVAAQHGPIREVIGGLEGIASTAAASFADAVVQGESLQTVLTSLATDLTKMMIQMAIMMALRTAMGAAVGGAEQGAVIQDGEVMPLARGGVVTRPTIFPMARGWGLMGEAGPEAVMPLTRTSGGDLGVRASSPSQQTTVNIVLNDRAGVRAREERREDDGRGNLTVEMRLDPLVSSLIARRGTKSNRAARGDERGPIR